MIRFIKRLFLVARLSLLRLTHNMYWAVDIQVDDKTGRPYANIDNGLRLVRDADVARWDNGMPGKYLRQQVITAHPSILEQKKDKVVIGNVYSKNVAEFWVFVPKSYWTEKKDRHDTLKCSCFKCSAVQLELKQKLGRACGASVSSVVEAASGLQTEENLKAMFEELVTKTPAGQA